MIKDIMAANEAATPNEKEMAVLREYFPACFAADGSFDIERFKEYLSDKVAVTNEGYELRFLGKNYARLLASLDTTTVIVPDEAHNSKPENANSQNVYISGDNLDGLKHLLKSYAKKVKCIYIDPPYNTGSDSFVYNDNFNFTPEELSSKLSISDDHAKRILDLTKRGSASHSAWLIFMYSRLLLARDLLSDDGVIFISIDRNEANNLSSLCNDVFGEENLVAQLVWKKRNGGGNDSFFVAVDHEYILVYARSISKEYHQAKWRIPYDMQYLKRYSEVDEEGNRYYWDTLARDGLRNPIHIQLTAPDGSIININSQKSQETVAEELAKGWIKIERGDNGWMVHHRVYQPDGRVQRSIIDDAGTNTDSSNEISNAFGFEAFDYAKPTGLIMRILEMVPLRENDIFVDFFSGSGTSACSAMQIAKSLPIRFIMIQLPENLDQTANDSTGEKKLKTENLIHYLDSISRPHTLDYVGIERIILAAAKIKEEHPESTADLGFRHFTLVEPSAETLDKLEKFEPESGFLLQNTVLQDFGVPTVLATWLVRDGYGFTAPVQSVDFAGYTGYYMDKHLYLINPELKNEAIAAITEKYETDGAFNPENVVLCGYSFTWTETESLKVNLARLKDTEKNLRINFDIRY